MSRVNSFNEHFSGAYIFSGIMISFTCPSEAEAYLDGRGRVADELVDKEQVDS